MASKAPAKKPSAKKPSSAAKAKGSDGAKKPKKSSKMKLNASWKTILLLIVLLALAIDVAFSFLPKESVPELLKPLHNNVVATRNTVVAKSGLPVSRYEDNITIPVEDALPVKIHFAPSPNISIALDNFISGAKNSLSICAYDIKLPDAADAMIAAAKRGVKVRVVTDTDNMKNIEIQRLENAGIPVKQDHKNSIMHNKFIVSDGYRVWTGSYNFTPNCSFKNDNNALEINSPALALCYQAKFYEYWKGEFSQSAPRLEVNQNATLGNISISALFSPSAGVQSSILKELTQTRSKVDVMAFAFTSKEIAEKLRSLASTGVQVRCLLDGEQAENQYSQAGFFNKTPGIKLRISANHSGKMHNKVIIIDSDTVITGSYNFTRNAEMNNDENALIIRSNDIANAYEAEFQRCWDGVKGY